jgi:Tetracyclin repressor-like, C-terminal domain
VNVGRIAREEHAAVPVCGHLAVMNLETRQPVAVGDRDATDPLIENPLQILLARMQVERRQWGVMDLGHQAGPAVAHGHHDDRARGREDGVHRFRVHPMLGVAVTEDEPLALKRALQLRSDQMPHRAVGAVGSHHPGRRDLLRQAVCVAQAQLNLGVILSQGDDFNASLDRHAELAQLGADEHDRLVRSGLISSQIMGLAMMRYIWRIEPVASMTDDEIIAAVAPNLQHYIEGDLAP